MATKRGREAKAMLRDEKTGSPFAEDVLESSVRWEAGLGRRESPPGRGSVELLQEKPTPARGLCVTTRTGLGSNVPCSPHLDREAIELNQKT